MPGPAMLKTRNWRRRSGAARPASHGPLRPLPQPAHMTAAKPPTGGIKLLVRRPAPPTDAVMRLSLDEEVAAKKAAAAAVPIKGPSELYAEVVEATGGDVGAAAVRIKELLAAGSRDAAALGGMGLREGIVALHTHGARACWRMGSTGGSCCWEPQHVLPSRSARRAATAAPPPLACPCAARRPAGRGAAVGGGGCAACGA